MIVKSTSASFLVTGKGFSCILPSATITASHGVALVLLMIASNSSKTLSSLLSDRFGDRPWR